MCLIPYQDIRPGHSVSALCEVSSEHKEEVLEINNESSQLLLVLLSVNFHSL